VEPPHDNHKAFLEDRFCWRFGPLDSPEENGDVTDDGDEKRWEAIVDRTKLPSVSMESHTKMFLGTFGDQGRTSWRGIVLAFIVVSPNS